MQSVVKDGLSFHGAPQVFAQYPNVQPPANEAKQDYFSIPEVEKIYTTPEIERIYYPSSKGIVDINRGSISVWLKFTPNPNLRDHLVFATDDSRISLHVDTFFHTGKGRDILRIAARAGGNRQNPQAPQRGFPEASIIIDNDWQLQDLCTNKPTICPLAAFPENEWHLVGMTWEGYPEGVVRIYLDGRLMGEGRYDSTNDFVHLNGQGRSRELLRTNCPN
jgi:hypothetical protein